MKFYFVKTPVFIQKLFANYYWRFNSENKTIYLTFDDGPTPKITPWVIETLAKYNAKATFFCIGKNIEQHPSIFETIISKGHSVGNHTYNHINGWNVPIEEYLRNIEMSAIYFSNKNKLFRPPYGKIKSSQAKSLQKLGYKIILWDVLSGDFDTTLSNEKCFKNVLKYTKKGSVIVFHDSLKSYNKLRFVLPQFLKYFSNKGYLFKAINLDTVAPNQ